MALLKDNRFLSNAVLADKLGRTIHAVRNMKNKLPPAGTCIPWSDEDRQLLADSVGVPEKELADTLGRSVQAVRNERLNQRRKSGAPAKNASPSVPHQDLWDRPPGTYVEIIGQVLIDTEDCMAAWMHAHGYSTFAINFQDPLGWTTIVCVKEE
jgi:hypothetical protein